MDDFVDGWERFAGLCGDLSGLVPGWTPWVGADTAPDPSPEPGSAAHQERAADIVILRLWTALVEHRVDDDALDQADALVGVSAALDPGRRALLHLNLAATLQEHLASVDLAAMNRIERHLAAARDLGQLVGLARVAAAALSRLALMAMLRGQVPSALHHAATLRHLSRDAADELGGSWEQRIRPVEQWARHCTNVAMDAALIDDLVTAGDTGRRSAMVCAVTTAVQALAAIDAGEVERTRQLLDRVLDDPFVRTAGPWLTMLVLLDGYLAISSRDERRLQAAVEDLRRMDAEAEARLLEATELVQDREYPRALERLGPVTAAQIPSITLTYPSTCVLQAVVHHRLGDPDAAHRLIAQALADTQRTGVLRPFTIHDPAVIRELLSHLVTDNPATEAWRAEVVAAVDRAMRSPANRTTSIRLPLEQTAVAVEASPLTTRESEVLTLLAQGADQNDLAAKLFVSVTTVKTHLRSIRRKLDVERSRDAVRIAQSAGWIEE
ncbi:regulatory LuxR family protein [Nocardioides sp. SLBN-35]|nr:regulatory LuxR family protein [Nocardioides sp. SLBN-35]